MSTFPWGNVDFASETEGIAYKIHINGHKQILYFGLLFFDFATNYNEECNTKK